MEEKNTKKHVKIIVLGDIGRSPRMQYHALSLANYGFSVTIIGYLDSKPLPELLANKNINIRKLHGLSFKKLPLLLGYVLKTVWLVCSLFLTLLITGNCNYLLCQNPPAIPTLFLCRFYCLLTRTKYIIDWHNYGYTILALKLSEEHLLSTIAKNIERWFGQSSDKNICVTYAMKNDLLVNWNVSAKVLYDRPPKIFYSLSLEEKHDFFLKISEQYSEFKDPQNKSDTTAFTKREGDKIVVQGNRPGLLFSSTSWTSDEDFGILLSALQVYETTYSISQKLPKLLCVITGKGEMKDQYINEIASRNWQNVTVLTPWLEAADYPKMVGCADLGVCLHKSSSGLDLPMKVVDMFGAGLPVCAFQYNCINELIEPNKNGYLFKSGEQLATQLLGWFENFPNNKEQNRIHQEMRENLKEFQKIRWEDNWNLRIKPIFEL